MTDDTGFTLLRDAAPEPPPWPDLADAVRLAALRRRRGRRRGTLIGLAAGVAAVSVAAYVATVPRRVPAAPVAAPLSPAVVTSAGRALAAAGSARFGIAELVVSGKHSVTYNRTGAVDWRTGRGVMHETSVTRKGRVTQDLRLLDGVVYVHQPGMRTWYHARQPESLSRTWYWLGGFDPVGALAALRGPVDTIREVGREDVGGTPATHYAFTIRKNAVPESAAMTAHGTTADLWLNDAGLPVRLRVRIGAGEQNLEVLLSDFGRPVAVTRP